MCVEVWEMRSGGVFRSCLLGSLTLRSVVQPWKDERGGDLSGGSL